MKIEEFMNRIVVDADLSQSDDIISVTIEVKRPIEDPSENYCETITYHWVPEGDDYSFIRSLQSFTQSKIK